MSNKLEAIQECDPGSIAIAYSTPNSDTVRVHQNDSLIARSELKFAITEEKAARICEAAAQLLARDPHTSRVDGTYEVHTLYLDSPEMAIYRKSLNRDVDRFKLRMRFYDDDPSSPVFLEIKQTREGRGIKKRAAIDRETAKALFTTGDLPNISFDAASGEFWETVRRFNARPIIHIGYLREAFLDKDSPATRLTLDRAIRCQPAPPRLTTSMRNPVHIWQGKVILEIKFAGEMPAYLHDLIHSFGLEPAKASKYMESVSSRFGNGPKTRLVSRNRQLQGAGKPDQRNESKFDL